MRVRFMLARVHTTSSPIREKGRERERGSEKEGLRERVRKKQRERERERERERVFIFKRNVGCLGTF